MGWIQWTSKPDLAQLPGALVRVKPSLGQVSLRSDPTLDTKFLRLNNSDGLLGIVIVSVKFEKPSDDFSAQWSLVFLSGHLLGWIPTYNLEEYLEIDVLNK